MVESLLSQANGIDLMRTYTAVICQNWEQLAHIIIFIDASLVSTLQPEFVTSLCDTEPGKSVDHPEEDPEDLGA